MVKSLKSKSRTPDGTVYEIAGKKRKGSEYVLSEDDSFGNGLK